MEGDLMGKQLKKILYYVPIILLTVSCSNSQSTTSEKFSQSKQHKWTELSSKYENSYSDNKIQKNLSLDVLSNWWLVLEDDTLTQLINLSLNNNKSLQEARARVNEARAALGISQAKLLPWLDSNNGWERKKTSDNSPNPSGIANVYKLGIDASWEIDIFGGNQYKVEAATADLQTQHAQLHSAWVTLTSEVAINYLSLRTLQERLSIAEANLALQEDTVQLLQSKYNNGLIDGLALPFSNLLISACAMPVTSDSCFCVMPEWILAAIIALWISYCGSSASYSAFTSGSFSCSFKKSLKLVISNPPLYSGNQHDKLSLWLILGLVSFVFF